MLRRGGESVGKPRFPHLFVPFSLKGLELPNRVVMAPMATHLAGSDGRVTRELIRHYRERAEGGVGLITVESCYVAEEGRGGIRRLGIHHDGLVPGLAELTSAVKGAGARVMAELHHAGALASAGAIGRHPIGPSAVAAAYGYPVPTALDEDGIARVRRAFADGARRAVQAGFDAILIHAAHGYLLGQFLSPRTNLRTDQYGGELNGRARLLLEVVSDVREAIGDAVPLVVRLSVDEHLPGGFREAEAQIVGRWLREAGADCLFVSAGTYDSMWAMIPPELVPEGWLVDAARRLKDETGLPVGVSGKICDPSAAESIIADGKVDLVVVGRSLLADPHWAAKAQTGREDEIRPCLACCRCNERLHRGLVIACSVNPSVGSGWQPSSVRVQRRPRRVLVVGAGPAGVAAALEASARGCSVVLCDEAEEIGGAVRLASRIPYKRGLQRFVAYLESELRRSSVEVRLATRVTGNGLAAYEPDVVIVATGAGRGSPPPPLRSIGSALVSAEHVLTGQLPLSARWIAVVGGGMVGLEVSWLLASGGRKVTLIEKEESIGQGMEPISSLSLVREVLAMGTRILVGAVIEGCNCSSMAVVSGGRRVDVPFDVVVDATGRRPRRELLGEGAWRGDLVVVGDCVAPRNVYCAVHEGYAAGSCL